MLQFQDKLFKVLVERVKNKYSVSVFQSCELVYSEDIKQKNVRQSIEDIILNIEKKIEEIYSNRTKNEITIPRKMEFVLGETKLVQQYVFLFIVEFSL